jgi:hypothetical protein
MRRVAAAGAIVVASVASGHGQEAIVHTAPPYVEVAVLEFKDSTDAPGWRLFALKSSATTVTVAVFRDDADPVPAMQLALNATPPVPVQFVHPAHFEIWAPELTNVLSRNTLHALYISVGGREHTVRLTAAQRQTLLAQALRVPTDSFAEDSVQGCRLASETASEWIKAAMTNLVRRFGIVNRPALTTRGRITLRARFSEAGVPASIELVPSRTTALTVMALRAMAGARVPPPSGADDGIVSVCVELNPGSEAQLGNGPRQLQD